MTARICKHRWSRALVVLSCLACAATSIQAYVPLRWGTQGMRGAWPLSRFPLVFSLNDATARSGANFPAAADFLAAVRASMKSWQRIPTATIRFAEPQLTNSDTALDDGINLITGAENTVNREILGGDLGAVALTRISFNPNTGEILESDILLNPSFKFSVNMSAGTFDLQSILTHELGHALGCDHAVTQNDTMFSVLGQGEFFQRTLSADAIGFASFTYPEKTRVGALGVISGRITSAGKGIFGASVAAMNLDRNLIYTALSEPDGSYAMRGPVAGRYAVYAEPLDGPATPEQLMVQGPAAYYQGLNTAFRTVFSEPQNLGVEGAARTLQINLAVPSLVRSLNIDRIGRGDPESGLGYLSGGAVVANPGETLSLWIGGQDTWKVASAGDIHILGTGVILDSPRGVRVLRNASGTEVGVSVTIQIAPDASPGPRTVVLKVGDQQAASTGGIVVAPRSLPATTLFFPYLFASADQYTGLALANPTADLPATIRITGLDGEGALFWSQDAAVPAEFSLAGGTQAARLERQIFNLPFDVRQSGSMTVESDSPALQGFFLTGDLAGKSLDGAEAFTRGFKQLWFVDVLQDANTTTEIHLMNIADTAISVDLTLISDDGTTFRATRIIPAGGKIGESVRMLFNFSGVLHSSHVKAVTAADALAGFELVRQSESILGLNAMPLDNAGSVVYSPQLAVGDLGVHFDTRLNVVNVGDARATVTARLFDEQGLPLVSGAKTADLTPGAHWSFDVGALFGLAQGQGYIRVSASAGTKLLGNVLFGDGDPTVTRLKFGAALALFASGATHFEFPHAAQDLAYYTGLALLAPSGCALTLEAFDSMGASKGVIRRDLGPGQRLAALLQDLMPATAGQVGGHIRVISDRPVIGFEIFGTTDGQLLSAVPPQRR